jgi:hypothetical protein
LGQGRTVLVATDGSLSSVDPKSGEPWTTWPTWPSYLPIVRELLTYASGGEHAQWQQTVGRPLSGLISGSALPRIGKLEIARPDGRVAPVTLTSTPAGTEWTYADTDVSGVYTLGGLPHGRTQQFAVNVETAEGDLTKIDPQQLPPDLKVRTAWQGETSGRAVDAVTQSAWNEPILWCVAALLFVELFMAWQFGRGAL